MNQALAILCAKVLEFAAQNKANGCKGRSVGGQRAGDDKAQILNIAPKMMFDLPDPFLPTKICLNYIGGKGKAIKRERAEDIGA